MTNKISEQELRIEFPQFFEKIDRVIFESRKYNLIDRLFHLYIEKNEIYKYLNSLKLNSNIYFGLLDFLGLLGLEIDFTIEKIIDCYGLHPIDIHENSERLMLINNPQLLGISPLLFRQKLWTKVIISDIGKSNYKVDDVNDLYNIIKNCLNETLERLGRKNFDGLKHHGYGVGWDKEILTPSDISTLVVDDIYDLDKNPKSTENIMKDLMKWHSENQLNKIVLYGNFTTGKLIERIIEMFAKKSIKLSNENIQDIKSFISKNFKNSKGKNLRTKEIKNKSFFNEHIKFIKSILIDCIKKGNIKCTEKDIARIIHKSLPELGELKTIENY